MVNSGEYLVLVHAIAGNCIRSDSVVRIKIEALNLCKSRGFFLYQSNIFKHKQIDQQQIMFVYSRKNNNVEIITKLRLH